MKKFGTAAVLAGGKSSRMGFDKQRIEFSGENIVKRNTEELKRKFSQIIVVTNSPEIYEDEDYITVIQDIIFQKGPLSGIHAALKYSESRYVYFLACDMPEIDMDFIEYMKNETDRVNAEICIPMRDGRLELFNGFYRKSLVPKIEKILKEDRRAIRALVEISDTHIVNADNIGKKDIFLNLNTQKELEDYRKLKEKE